MEVLLVAALLGVITAAIAHKKGRSAFGWWLFGTALFIAALPAVLIVSDQSGQPCPHCRGRIDWGVAACRHCGRDVEVRHTPAVKAEGPAAAAKSNAEWNRFIRGR